MHLFRFTRRLSVVSKKFRSPGRTLTFTCTSRHGTNGWRGSTRTSSKTRTFPTRATTTRAHPRRRTNRKTPTRRRRRRRTKNSCSARTVHHRQRQGETPGGSGLVGSGRRDGRDARAVVRVMVRAQDGVRVCLCALRGGRGISSRDDFSSKRGKRASQ